MAIEIVNFPLEIMIFHSYVSLPDGTSKFLGGKIPLFQLLLRYPSWTQEDWRIHSCLVIEPYPSEKYEPVGITIPNLWNKKSHVPKSNAPNSHKIYGEAA